MIPSLMDDYTCDRYTSGDCFLLAKKLSDFGVGQLTAVVAQGDWELWSHMMIKVGPDSYLDIEGIWPAEYIIENHGRGSTPMQIIPITNDEYDELIIGQSPGIDSEEKLDQITHDLVNWYESTVDLIASV